jgi:phage terminase small subunit
MPVLTNPRHERFCQELAKGKSATEAYETAGFKSSRPNASRLQHQENLRQRVVEIQSERSAIEREATEKAAEALSIDKQWVMSRLVENVDRSMQATQARDREGNPTGDFKYEGSVANKALELLGKELGMFIDRKNLNVTGDLGKLSDAELLAILEEADEGDDQEGDPAPSSGSRVSH